MIRSPKVYVRDSGLVHALLEIGRLDLLLEQGGRPRLAIEVKRSNAPKIEAGFTIACDDLGIEHRFVVGSGQDSYKTRGGVTVHSLLSAIAAVREVLKSPFAPR